MRGEGHWAHHARQWARIGAPLRPGPEDVAIMTSLTGGVRRALLLGVTPELATLAWPGDATLVAVDRSRAMIGAIFPSTPIRAQALVGDWCALPLMDGAVDLAIGDGCLSNLPYPTGYDALAAELHRVLVPGGRLALRLFAAPAVRETLAEVAAALPRIGGMHALKWRVAMALPRSVPVVDILAAFDAVVPDRDALPWPRAITDTIDAYRGSALGYTFPTLAEVRARFATHFTEHALHVPRYELGERCPTIVFQR